MSDKETKQTPKAVERVALIRQALSVVKQDYSGECSQMATRREYVEDAVSQMIDAGYRVTQKQAPAVEAALRPFAKAYEDWNGGNAREYFASAVVPAHFRAAALALASASEAAAGEPYAYEVDTTRGKQLVYADSFDRMGWSVPQDAVPLYRNAAPQPASEPAERVPPYDGLLEEFVDEVARLCNDAPGSRNAVYSALQHCNVNIIPAEQPASEQQATRGLSTAQIDAIRDSFSGRDDMPSRALVQRIATQVLAAAKGEGHVD